MAKNSKSKFSIDEAEDWGREVLENKIIVADGVKLSVERHFKDLEEGKHRGLYFDRDAAEHVLNFYKFLRHSKGQWAGQEFILEPWQKFLLGVLFGWKHEENELRRFRSSYCELPRKNGKSTLAGGVGNYLFFADGEPGAEVYSVATKAEQAKIVFSEACRMVRSSPSLASRINIYKNNMSIDATNSKFEPLGADDNTLDGLNVHGALVDELHAHKNRGVYDVIDTATGARLQSLIFSITTAGTDRGSVCYQLHDYADKVVRGLVQDDSFFSFISAASQNDDWTDPKVWAKANPNFGISVMVADLEKQCRQALEMPSFQNTFRRLRLNQWTEQITRWIPMDKWEACSESFDPESLRGQTCYAGLDLSSTTDLSALVLVFKDGEKVRTLPFFWIPGADIVARSLRDRAPYDAWVRDGLVIATPGDRIDYDFIRHKVLELADIYNIKELAIDRWNAQQIATQLKGEGINVVPFGQGYASMSSPTKELMALILGKQISHGGNPVLNYMASNVSVQQDAAGNIKPAKDQSFARIDGIVAFIMAIGAMILDPEDTSNPYLEGKGIYCG